jgi:hypothetical protein
MVMCGVDACADEILCAPLAHPGKLVQRPFVARRVSPFAERPCILCLSCYPHVPVFAYHVRGGGYRLAIDPITQSALTGSANIRIVWSRVSINGATIRAFDGVPIRR